MKKERTTLKLNLEIEVIKIEQELISNKSTAAEDNYISKKHELDILYKVIKVLGNY